MRRYKLIIEYEGTKYHGWQSQKDLPTIQDKIESAILAFSGEKIITQVAGRTDAGVHALGQVCHMDLQKSWPIHTVESALNFYLMEEEISILKVEEVSEDFHARFSAKCRYYVYCILNRRAPPTLDKNRVTHCPKILDINLMQEASKFLIGHHDFTSFRSSECQAKSPMITLDNIDFSFDPDLSVISIKFKARSFLHHMVRNIVGSLIQVGLKEKPIDYIEETLRAGDRVKAGPMAAAHGLYLYKVDYF